MEGNEGLKRCREDGYGDVETDGHWGCGGKSGQSNDEYTNLK